MSGIPQETARKLLDHLNGRVALPVTGPLKLWLTGTLTSFGTFTHSTSQTITLSLAVFDSDFNPGSAYMATNETAVVFTNMPDCTITGWFITDGAGTLTCWEGETVRDRIVPLGDSYEVPAGALKVRLEF